MKAIFILERIDMAQSSLRSFRHILPVLISALMIFLLLCGAGKSAASAEGYGYYAGLRERLIREGFPEKSINKFYSDPRADFNTEGVSRYFVHKESTLNYDQFTEPEPIAKSREYLVTHRDALRHAEKTYGVDPEVITAIALVETRLGTYTGKRSVFNTLSTMAALGDVRVRNALWPKMSEMPKLSRSRFDSKSQSKSEWAYKELKAFLKYTWTENLDPLAIDGSYAGAMGICQFMPSNIGPLAKDGNGDGRIDLFDHADAIASIANYLSNYGWRPGISQAKAFDVVYHYNHSSYYVDTILKITRILKKGSS